MSRDTKNQMNIYLGLKWLIAACSFMLSTTAFAVLVEYEQVNQSANHYEYNYTVTNTSGFAIEAFSIFFEASGYQNIVITDSPLGWDPLVIEPDPFFGDGFADWYSLDPWIAPGEILSGFTVAFDWIGVEENPTAQWFEVYDPFTFEPLESGLTSAKMAPVSEPSLGWLLFAGLLGHFITLSRARGDRAG